MGDHIKKVLSFRGRGGGIHELFSGVAVHDDLEGVLFLGRSLSVCWFLRGEGIKELSFNVFPRLLQSDRLL